MTYIIKVDYTTGNSFGTEEVIGEEVDPFEWESLEVAKINLKRIKEHYEWKTLYNKWENRAYGAPKKKPEPPSWRKVKTTDWSSTREISDLMNFVLDNGEEVQFWPPWCGYFETLNSAQITYKDNDNELSFNMWD